MKYTVEYLGGPEGPVEYASELESESCVSADVSARIGFRWARAEFNATCYRVVNASGIVVATGPGAIPRD